MAVKVNQALLEAQIGHQIDIAHYSNGVVNRLIGLLNKVDRDLFVQLMSALEQMPPESFTVERLDSMLMSVRMMNARAYQSMSSALNGDLSLLAGAEVEYQNNLFTRLLPVELSVATVDVGQVYAAAMARPMQGRLLKEWAGSIESDRMTRIRDAIRMGYVEGQTTSQIVQRIRGSRARGYEDGIIEIDRRNAESVVRTAIGHTAGTARDKFYQANDDLVKSLVWTSTLDTRTSPICRSRDRKRYDMNHKPVGHTFPWLGGPGMAHWNCRSTSVPVLKSLSEILGVEGLSDFKLSTRASMDGQVPADMSYGEWLKKQSAKRQIEILGSDRAALFRTGELPVEKFVNDKGKALTLEQLKAKELPAFEKAGLLNPIQVPRGMPKDEIARFLANPQAQREMLGDLYKSQGLSFDYQMRRVRDIAIDEGYTASHESLGAIRYYTGSGYKEINQRMRDAADRLTDRQFTALTASGLDGMDSFDGSVYRAPTSKMSNAEKWWDRAVVGQPLEMGNQLLSFSAKDYKAADFAKGSDLLLRIEKAGPGVYIDPLSLNQGEHEVLLPPGLKYKVLSLTTKTVKGKLFRIIDLEIVSD